MKSIDPEAPPAPKRLYKYRAFSPFLLNELCNSETYLAPPATFNDPLDTRPFLTKGGAIVTKLALLKRIMSEQRARQSFGNTAFSARNTLIEKPCSAL